MDSPMIPIVNTFLSSRKFLGMENSSLTEVITVYEKLKKGRESRVYRQSHEASPRGPGGVSGIAPALLPQQQGHEVVEVQETIPMVPSFHVNRQEPPSRLQLMDFTKYSKGFVHRRYLYFSAVTNMLQADSIQELSDDYSQLLQSKNYWLNIFDPTEEDLYLLFNSFAVHDLTLNDIRDGYTEEKIEAYKHYTFISLRLENSSGGRIPDRKRSAVVDEDVDFNILLFKDFIITMHNKKWQSITDILGFVHLVYQHSSALTPDWVLFSCFIELSQDARFVLDMIEPEVIKIRVSRNTSEVAAIMQQNFELELRLYKISRYIKPKMTILRQLKLKCSKRVSRVVLGLLDDIYEEFREQNQDLAHFSHVLERSQDTFLALVTAEQTKQGNDTNVVMKRVSEFALIFLPMQAIAGFFGMNCTVPWQTGEYSSQLYFWILTTFCVLLGLSMYLLRTKILGAVHNP